MIFIDLAILLYSIGSIMGSQGELLTQKLSEKFKISVDNDSVLLWLIFTKAAYEYCVNFPYDLLHLFSGTYIQLIITLGTGLNLIKNVAVLVLFVFLIIIIGIREIKKYSSVEKEIKEEVGHKVKELYAIQKEAARDDDDFEGSKMDPV